jgi:threonine dehydrogenase-like Zn-dependent dehydrogenase
VVVLGAGTVGLCVIAALRHFVLPASVLAVAKYPEQRRLAAELGADTIAEPSESKRAVRRMTGSLALSTQRPDRAGTVDRLTGGADVVFDCVGSESSLAESLAVVRAGGTVVLVGMPGVTRVDLAPLWQREIVLRGAYAYGTEVLPGSSAQDGRGEAGPERRTFDLAFELVRAAGLDRLVSAYYPLDSYEEAIAHAAAAGRRGAVKVVFDLRRHSPRWRDDRTADAAGVAGGAAG